MAKFEFSPSQSEAVYQAQFDRGKAIRVLELMLPYLEERKPMPAALARHLAGAIRAAIASTNPDRVLTEHLHLRKRAGRPPLDMIALANAVRQELMDGATSINEAAELVSRRSDFKGADVSTVKKHYRMCERLGRLIDEGIRADSPAPPSDA